MKEFLSEEFLLQSDTASKLYHQYAEHMPIIDYHCHLPVEEIAEDKNFENLTQIWLYGDHYKWRAMRANGVNEAYCTGDKSDYEKFEKWAETVPYTLRNPLFHWTHLELKRYFDVKKLLNPTTAKEIYDACSEMLRSKEYSVRNLLRKMNVKVVCTTDDPIDTLECHQKIKDDGFEIKVLPAFRPDKAMNPDDLSALRDYIQKVEQASGVSVTSYQSYLDALKQRHDYFHSMGCRLSDHGLSKIYADEYTDAEIENIFQNILSGKDIDQAEADKFRSALLYVFALWDNEKGWVQQYHLGAFRNNNSRALQQLGPDTGWDSIGDFRQGPSMVRFFDRLDKDNHLTKTILYNLNAVDNDLFATMAGNYNDGSVAGKMQYGAAWWFHDQLDGMTKQINSLSNMGLLSRMVGMLTDSRSFLSYPRHEYFRRLLCSLLGNDIENGELPNDLEWTGKIIQDICYHNSRNYFDFGI